MLGFCKIALGKQVIANRILRLDFAFGADNLPNTILDWTLNIETRIRLQATSKREAKVQTNHPASFLQKRGRIIYMQSKLRHTWRLGLGRAHKLTHSHRLIMHTLFSTIIQECKASIS